MRQCNLVFLVKPAERKILLAMKKRGFGVGKWNGVGGKVQGQETVEDAAIREVKEEISVSIDPKDLIKVAAIDFYFENKSDFDQQVHVFFVERWQGEPIESEEMKPAWYQYDKLPYKEMWIDDIHWLPRVLASEKIKAKFVFNESGSAIKSQKVDVVK